MYRLGDERLEKEGPAERDLEVLVDDKLNLSPQCALATKTDNCILEYIKYSIASQQKEVIVAVRLPTSQVLEPLGSGSGNKIPPTLSK